MTLQKKHVTFSMLKGWNLKVEIETLLVKESDLDFCKADFCAKFYRCKSKTVAILFLLVYLRILSFTPNTFILQILVSEFSENSYS